MGKRCKAGHISQPSSSLGTIGSPHTGHGCSTGGAGSVGILDWSTMGYALCSLFSRIEKYSPLPMTTWSRNVISL